MITVRALFVIKAYCDRVIRSIVSFLSFRYSSRLGLVTIEDFFDSGLDLINTLLGEDNKGKIIIKGFIRSVKGFIDLLVESIIDIIFRD